MKKNTAKNKYFWPSIKSPSSSFVSTPGYVNVLLGLKRCNSFLLSSFSARGVISKHVTVTQMVQKDKRTKCVRIMTVRQCTEEVFLGLELCMGDLRVIDLCKIINYFLIYYRKIDLLHSFCLSLSQSFSLSKWIMLILTIIRLL